MGRWEHPAAVHVNTSTLHRAAVPGAAPTRGLGDSTVHASHRIARCLTTTTRKPPNITVPVAIIIRHLGVTSPKCVQMGQPYHHKTTLTWIPNRNQ